MPVRGDLGSIGTAEAHYEWRSLGAGVAGNRGKIAALYDRRPLQIAEVHNLGRRRAIFFLLAINHRRKRGADQRNAETSCQKFIHPTLLRQKVRVPNWPKDTPPIRLRQLKSISRSRIGHSPCRYRVRPLEASAKSCSH